MSLIVEKKGAVGWIVFNQPAKKNAINDAMWRGIPEAMAHFDADREVRCVAFRGAGTEAFASGADISEFEQDPRRARRRRRSTTACSTACCIRSRTRPSLRWR